MSLIHLSQVGVTEDHVPGQLLCSPGSILTCARYLDTVTKSSTEQTIPKNVQIEWDEFRSSTNGHVHDSYNSRLCNTPVEPKQVNLQPSPSPLPTVPLPQIRDTGPGPQPSQGDGVIVQFMGNNKYRDIALQAANEPLAPDEEADVMREDLHCGKNKKKKKKNKNKNKKKNKKKKKEEEAMRKEEHKDEIVTMAQVNREEWCKAAAEVDNTQVHNAALEFRTRSHTLQQLLKKPSHGLPASTVLVESSFETSQEPLFLSTHHHFYQGLNLSPTEKEQMAVYQRAIEGINDRNGRHVIIFTTLPNVDQWAMSLVECVNTAREFIGTKVKEGIITLRIRHEDKVEVTDEVIETPVEEIFEEFTWEATWNLIEDEVTDEVKDEVKDEVNGGNEHLELDCPGKKKEAMRKWRQAIMRHPALTYLWAALYNLVFSSNAPQKHIKIDDEERQLSDQYYSFPHRPRSRRMPILKILLLSLLLILLLLAYLISFNEFSSSVYVGSRKRPNDLCSEEW